MFKSIAVLALAGSAIARPALEARKVKTVVHTVVVTHTQYYTYTGPPKASSKAPEYTPAPQPAKPTSAKQEYVVVTPTPKPSSAPPAPKPSSAAPAPSYAAPAPAGTYMDIVNEYRVKLGKKAFEYSSKLEANALDTVKSSNGQMTHKLNPGSFAQVLGPEKAGLTAFKHVYLGGWLCERADNPAIAAECPEATKGFYHTSTGHYDILVNPDYTKIGCANFNGIWSCDCA